MLSLLHRYAFRELLKSFILAFFTLASIMLLGALFKPLKMGLSLSDVAGLLPYLLPYSLAWVIPASLLTACVMAYGRLSAENELLAVCASGVPLRYMCYPALLLGILLTAICLPLNDTIIPKCRKAMKSVLRDAFYKNPFRLPILGTFEIGDQKMYIERVEGNMLYNVIVVEPPIDENDREAPKGGKPSQKLNVFRARRARYEVNKDAFEIRIILEDAQFTIVSPGEGALGWQDVTAEEQVVTIKTEDTSSLRDKRRSEYTTAELWAALATVQEDLAKAEKDKKKDLIKRFKKQCVQYETEIRVREALAFSVLALCLVGVPLGIWIRKESRLASFALAVVVFLMLYAMLIGGEGMALEQKIPPKVALWTPVFATGMLGALMLLRTFRR